MVLDTDTQTLADLNIPGKYTNTSVYSLFNHTHTRGGERLLEAMFAAPLTDPARINHRAAVFGFFTSAGVDFPVEDKLFETAEHYLGSAGPGSLPGSLANAMRCKALRYITSGREYETLAEGILATACMLRAVAAFTRRLTALPGSQACADMLERMNGLLGDPAFSWIDSLDGNPQLSLWDTARYDYFLRGSGALRLKSVLAFIYELDVNICVGNVAARNHFTRARAKERGSGILRIDGLRHPHLPGGVANDIRIDSQNNVFFLTGANMAGKSTLMKSVGIAVFLAHIGLPVAASQMEFSVLDGMYTSINVADNLNMGYSHYYAEVLRIKKVAVALSQGRNLLVIFDELFKGTNVKDAYDATVAVTEALATHRNCAFIISTHITEAGDTLKERLPRIILRYLPTEMEAGRPVYTYKLREGITGDRHGMVIIRNEKIIEIITGTGV